MKIAEPAAHGFDASRLAAIDTLLQARYIDSGKLPNAQLLIARDGEIVHFSNAGAAREGGKSVDEGSLFRIASMTKPITSVAFMMLVEQGLVAVDTPVHHVLPEFKDIGVYDGGGGGSPCISKTNSVIAGESVTMLDVSHLRFVAGICLDGRKNAKNKKGLTR